MLTLRPIARWFLPTLAVLCAEPGAELGADEPQAPIRLPTGAELIQVDFDRHVASLLGRLGCNSAACHGSFQGKGGLRLSLFGQSPAQDFAALIGEGDNPRVDRNSPEDSLVLIKATGGDGHGGGTRFTTDSWEFQIFRRWIADGAKRDLARSQIVHLRITPPEMPPLAPGQVLDVSVWASFQDDSTEDVTPFAEFRSRDETIATVNAHGTIEARSAGSTAVIVAYRGEFVAVPVFVPYAGDGVPNADVDALAPANWIDQEVNAQLVQLNLQASPTADDVEFLRRVTLDVAGITPTPVEVREFLRDVDPLKRTKVIESLLHHPRRAVAWATYLCDMTACNVEYLGPADERRARRAKMWHDWFRQRIADNLAYDQLVHGVLCAVSRHGESVDSWLDAEIALEQSARAGFESNYAEHPGLDLFWRRLGPQGPLPVEDLAELTASAFLGLRLHCARCHQHPYDRWTQSDFAGYANIFSRIEYGSSTELRQAVAARLEARRQARRAGEALPEFPRLQEVFVAPRSRPLIDAAAATSALPRPPGGPLLEGKDDLREELFRWLTEPGNRYFAPNLVNRVWARYFGAGLVEPVDAFSAANPASHPRLLQRLADEFVQSGYDLQHIERLILNSNTYQRTSRSAGNNGSDTRNLSHAVIRPLPAAVLIDSVNQALEATDDFGSDVPAGTQALEIAVNVFSNLQVQSMFRVLGRNERKALCECETAPSASIRRSLFTLSNQRVLEKLAQGRLARLLNENRTDADILEELYLATVSRHPDDAEREYCLKHLSESQTRSAAFVDITWSLLNSREFLTNH